MARKTRILFAGGIYHVTSRGNDRRAIFHDDRDRMRFLENLNQSAELYRVRVYLYCLMLNHIHLVVETPLGNLDRFMGSLLTGYTVYFNRRHQRTGHLMQGRYGAQVVEGTSYLLKLSRYIHLNPVHVKGTNKLPVKDRLRVLRDYRWSSFQEYTGRVKPVGWLVTGPLLALVSSGKRSGQNQAYAQYVETGLAQTDEEFNCLMKKGGIGIGSEEFIENIKNQHARPAGATRRREDILFRQIQTQHSVADIEAAVRKVIGADWELFQQYKAGRTVRGFLAWALHKYTGITQREVGQYVGVKTGSAVSHMIRAAQNSPQTASWRNALGSALEL